MALYTPAEMSAAFVWAKQEIANMAGAWASMIPDEDIDTLCSGILNVAAETRAKATPGAIT